MRAFIIRPFGLKTDRQGGEIDFERVERELIDPALASIGCEGRTTKEITRAGNIRSDLFRLLVTADLVLADISIHNANVFYELGIRHALRDRATFLLRCRADETVFDLQTERYLEYDRTEPGASLEALIDALRATQDAAAKDSPVFALLPDLQVQRRSLFLAAPPEFTLEVELAAGRRRVGDLALLAEEAQGFEWASEGLRLTGRALFDLGAFEGARVGFEALRELEGGDLEADIRLGTIHHRLGDLQRSDQAIRRALESPAASAPERAELRSLMGRNAKARWLAEWRTAPEARRQETALRSAGLTEAARLYAEGFEEDLNHFYSGLNALALRTIELELAKALPEAWEAQHDTPEDAMRERGERQRRALTIASALELLLGAARRRAERARARDVWAEISEADRRCLVAASPARVAEAYRRAIEGAPLQAVAAARGQLELLRDLGLLGPQVAAALAVFPPLPPDPAPSVQGRVLLFTGHMIDAPGRQPERFPARKERKARQAIRDAVRREQALAGGVTVGLAGGASGGDILFHEVCRELGVPGELHLALPREAYVAASVAPAGSAWVDRLDQLLAALPCHQLATSPKLPRWLRDRQGYDIWQRNNRWLLHQALARGPARVTLIALWDRGPADGPGGTQDMVETARARGAKIVVLDTKALFAR